MNTRHTRSPVHSHANRIIVQNTETREKPYKSINGSNNFTNSLRLIDLYRIISVLYIPESFYDNYLKYISNSLRTWNGNTNIELYRFP